MVATCFTPIGGHTMRATKLDACGLYMTGVSSCRVVSNGFVRVSRTPEYETGDEFVVKNANGDICVKEKTADQLKWLTVEAEFCKVDPDLFNLMSGSPLVLDDDTVPKSVGFRTREGVIRP